MKKVRFLFVKCAMLALGGSASPLPTQNPDDDRLAIILERIAKTTPVGLQILEEVQEMTPELNEIPSSKTLIDIVNDYAFNKGASNLNPIGWEAYQKRLLSS